MTIRWTPRTIAIAALVAVTIVGGAAFMLFGVGAELSEWRDIQMTVVVPGVHPDVASQVSVGDLVYTDPAAMYVGVIEEVSVDPMMRAFPDADGVVQASEDPLAREVTVVMSTQGRQSDEIIAIGNQVVQVGQMFSVITKVYQVRGQITRIDVD